ncbi:MAG: hypothetical protein R2710_18610 [Acidimicrobiales bacterium]
MFLSIGAAIASAFLLAGCGGNDYDGAAVEVIEGDLADTVGLGAVTATCDPAEGGDKPADGDTFTCSATTESGQTISYLATASGDRVEVETTNVILGSKVGEVERITAQSLADQFEVEVPAETVDCGEASIVVTPDAVVTCGVTDTETGDVYDIELSNIDLTGSDGNITFDWLLSDTPRS